MNKSKKLVLTATGLCLAAAMTCSIVGCNKVNPDNETRPLTIATQDSDGVFNPFFSTSNVDSTMISMTQISLLNADKNGNIVCGESEPTVAKDYSIRTEKEGGQDYTYYQFIIKNGIKFSDGKPLTINDVLFNLYVYLDPAYTGSSTIYSVDIVGLNDYRTQTEGASDAYANAFEEQFQQQANKRIDDLIYYVYNQSDFTSPSDKDKYNDISNIDVEKAEKDFVTVGQKFEEELKTDWTAVSASMDSYKETYGFTEVWQVYLSNNAGCDFYKKNSNGTYYKDENGNYQFDPDSEELAASITARDEYLAEHSGATVQDWAIDYAYQTYLGTTVQGTDGGNLSFILSYWATAQTILTQFTAEAKEDYFKGLGDTLTIPTISGITAKKGSEFKPSDKSLAQKYNDSYDMLQIKIKGVDPKAIYNFAFIVAPLHYYSTTSYTSSRTGKTTDYINSFDASTGNFGVAFNETGFMNGVLNAEDKVGVPVGAGAYKVTDRDGNDNVTGSQFKDAGFHYFKRNDYFETTGEKIQNAKIKLVQYRVVNSDVMVESLNQGSIDFGDPSATQDNKAHLNGNITQVDVSTNGYGYVGVNARFVPNINVRRAIMKAMNLKIITDNYYKGGLAEIIYRSMSKNNWAFPHDAGVYVAKDGTSYRYDSTGNEIQELLDRVLDEGYYLNEKGIYTNGSDTLDYKFTIAGGSTDHPAYAMFLNAAKILNENCHGIKVTVETNSQALTKLATGSLAVWAAAWTSTIDPDMYQVYHKDSKASSIKNWGYDYIIADKVKYDYEWSIISSLSTNIDRARATNDQGERTRIYSTCLDQVMELAVELPTYQRNDLFAYNANVIDGNSLQHGDDVTAYNGPLARLWEVSYK